jgi:PAP2 superfamily.
MRSFYGTLRVERLSPPVAARLMGYVTAALYSGLSANDPESATLESGLNGLPPLPTSQGSGDVDGMLTAIAAERVVVDSLLRDGLPTTRAAQAQLADSLAAARVALGISSDTKAKSEDLGRRIGLALVAWSRADGFDSTRALPAYVPPKGLAYWTNDSPVTTYASQSLSAASEFVAVGNPANVTQSGNAGDRATVLSRPKSPSKTLPAVNMAGLTEPYWSQLRPFVLKSWSECPVPTPPTYSADSNSEMYKNAVVVQSTRHEIRPEQRAIAFFWADNAGESGTPIGHWISIASQMVDEHGLSAEQAARLMFGMAAAQADAFIAAWGYKFQYALIRPRAYIRRVMEPAWEPLIPTPPFPEYPSAHSVQSAAAAEVLSALVGDSVSFADSTGLAIGTGVRTFHSFRDAAHEAGISRIYGGIHFPYGNLGGRALGECVGKTVIERLHLANAN